MQRTRPFRALIAIFWDLQPLWSSSLTKPDLLRFGCSSGHVLSKTKSVTPNFFYISDIANSSSFNGKSFRKKSMLEKFRANVLKGNFFRCVRARANLRALMTHSRPQRPRSFWSAPRIATSGLVQHRKSAIHGLPVTLRMFRVKSDKSDWFWSQSIVFLKPFKNGMSLDRAGGRDSWC